MERRVPRGGRESAQADLAARSALRRDLQSPGAWRLLPLLALLLPLVLMACSPGHAGGDELGFLRGGALWTLSPDGSNLSQIETGGFIGFAWSPDHHQIVLRMQNGKLPNAASAFGLGDTKSELGVTAIDGGNILQITPPDSGLLRSDAWWDGSGNRLLYREEAAGADGMPGAPEWKLSQADQPAGIARKDVPASVVLPAVKSDGSLIAGIDAGGRVWLAAPGESARMLATGALTVPPGAAAYPARPLWEPGADRLLYAIPGPESNEATLVLSNTSGQSHSLLTVANLEQYAWSPDGQRLLVRTATEYRVYNAGGAEQFGWNDAAAVSLAFWSPDSRMVLLVEPDGLTLVNVAAQRQTVLLRGMLAVPAAPGDASSAPLLRPAINSPWKADSSAFAFTNDGQGSWLAEPGKALATRSGSGDGLYVSNLDGHSGMAQFPTLIDWGEHQDVAWSMLDPNCAFLIL